MGDRRQQDGSEQTVQSHGQGGEGAALFVELKGAGGADAVRRDEVPQIFTEINVEYTVEGQSISLDRFVRAFELGAVKYCSVANMLKACSKINYSFILNGQRHSYPLPEAQAVEKAEG